jgi:hypothetical protein
MNHGINKNKPRLKQRKATADHIAETRPIHPDVLEEFKVLCSVPDEQNNLFFQIDDTNVNMYDDDDGDDD